MDKKTLKQNHDKRPDKPQFVAFGKDINKFVAMAVLVLLLLIVAVVLVIVLAGVLQAE